MRISRLYVPDSLRKGETITLDTESSRYLCKVMRYQIGDTVELFNGDGYNYRVSITDTGKATKVVIERAEENLTESPVAITLVQALAKGAKLDLVIQKATELGVHRISPISTERTVLNVDEKRADKKMQHWNKVAQSACAQCQRSVVPIIDPVVDLKTWLTTHADEFGVLIHPQAQNTLRSIASVPAVNVLVGPEGGFSDHELQLASEANIATVQCGPRILRTETAGFAAIAMLQCLIGDMA